MSRPVIFNDSNLEDTIAGLKITDIPYRAPSRDIRALPLPYTDRKVQTSAFYDDRKVNVGIEIGRDSRALLDAALDTLNGILSPPKKILKIEYALTQRQWTATFNNLLMRNMRGGHGEFDLEFQCTDALGYDISDTTIVTHNNNVAANKSYYFELDGSAEWQLPVITININSLLGGSAADIAIGNADTGQELSITRTWVAGEELIIDSVNKTVQVDGEDVDFSGAFPEFKRPNGTMTYRDTFTARNLNISGVYKKRYV